MKLYEFFKPDGSNWCQCSFHKEEKYCLLGALPTVYGKDSGVVCIKISRALAKRGCAGPIEFNDKPGRIVQEVIDLCKELDV